MPVPIALTLLALAALLVAERRESQTGVWIPKPLASLGFVWLALALGDFRAGGGPPYAGLVLLGLVLSWLGDVLLIPREHALVFRAGIFSFLLAHVAYLVAFASRGLDTTAAGVGAALLLGPAILFLRWLRPSLAPDFVLPVFAYVAVISLMLVCAGATVAAAGDPRILIGALMFACSDLSVARDRFVSKGFLNAAWGLPLYFGGQLVLASTVAPA